jgi:hypothetical protein
MAINVSFNGATIYKPGAYSRVNIDLGGGFPLSPTGLIAVFGEADAGTPGAQEVDIKNNVFSPEQIPTIRQKYRRGNIVDSSAFLFAPANDGAIPGGAQAIYYYKTNNSTRADLELDSGYGTIRSMEWGTGGNLITAEMIANDEDPASVSSSSSFDETSLSTGDSFALHVQGASANTFTLASAPTNNADLDSQLSNGANWSGGLPSGVTITVGGADGASTVEISREADATAHQLGYGRNFELVDGTGTPLAAMNMDAGLATAATEPSVEITLKQTRDLIEEEEMLGGNVVIRIGSSDGTSATVTVDSNNLTLTRAGGTNPGTHEFPLASYPTMLDIANAINLKAGWTASLSSTLYNQLSPTGLDQISSVGALSSGGSEPAQIKRDSQEVRNFFAESGMADLIDAATAGLPDAMTESALSGGTRGATTTADITMALEKFTKIRVNAVIPLFSRDASEDIADGLTDSGSSYTSLGIHQAVKTHLSLMATTKRRSERQGYLSYKASYVDSKDRAGLIADARSQLVIQDIRQIDAQGTIKWFQPWALACLVAGSRAGAPVGTPLTNKFLNATGVRHTAQPMSTAEENINIDFDPDLQTDDAIISGITFLEAPQTGGFKVVVDNTTYGRDANWVFNRANVLYAADVLAFDFRSQLENIFVGRKNTLQAAEIASVAEAILATFLNQGITVSTPDAPGGFKDLAVELDGNIIRVNVVVKLVEGVDFVLAEINLQRAQASA